MKEVHEFWILNSEEGYRICKIGDEYLVTDFCETLNEALNEALIQIIKV